MYEKIEGEIYCPKCGNSLKVMGEYRICDSKHLWTVRQGMIRGWEFEPEEIGKCNDCGGEYPSFELRSWDSLKLCDKCREVRKEAWRMDSEKSRAVLTITPIVTSEGKFYRYDTHIEIKPYPKPCMGGMYGGGGAKNEAELEKAIASFNSEVDELRKYGMKKVSIERLPEQVLTAQPVMIQAQEAPQDDTEPEEEKELQASLF